jgi:hypothetical protein
MTIRLSRLHQIGFINNVTLEDPGKGPYVSKEATEWDPG